MQARRAALPASTLINFCQGAVQYLTMKHGGQLHCSATAWSSFSVKLVNDQSVVGMCWQRLWYQQIVASRSWLMGRCRVGGSSSSTTNLSR